MDYDLPKFPRKQGKLGCLTRRFLCLKGIRCLSAKRRLRQRGCYI